MIRAFLLLVVLIFPLFACGGGGGGSTPTPVEPQTPAPMPPEPPAPPEPPTEPPTEPPPAVLKQPSVRIDTPNEGAVTFAQEVTVTGFAAFTPIPPDLDLSQYSVFAQSNDVLVEGVFDERGRFEINAVPLSAEDSAPQVRVFVRGPQGAETVPATVRLARTTDATAPVDMVEGFAAGDFLLLFPGNEVRTYNQEGVELGRVPLPDSGERFPVFVASWPATREVLQAVEREPGNCSLMAYEVNRSALVSSRELLSVQKGEDRTNCRLFAAVADGQLLVVRDGANQTLLRLDTQGNTLSNVSAEGLPGEFVPGKQGDAWYGIKTLLNSDSRFFQLQLVRFDPVTGADELLFESGSRSFLNSTQLKLIATSQALFYAWNGVTYRFDLQAMVEEEIILSGFTVADPRAFGRASMGIGLCADCFYAMDNYGRIGRVDPEQLKTDFLADTAPLVTPEVFFNDTNFGAGAILMLERHPAVTGRYDLDFTDWDNEFLLNLDTLEAQPLRVVPSLSQSGPEGEFVSPTEILRTVFVSPGDTDPAMGLEPDEPRISRFNTVTESHTILDIDYPIVNGSFGRRLVGLGAQYLVISNNTGIFEFEINSGNTGRSLRRIISQESLERADQIARFPGEQAALYAVNREFPDALFEVDFLGRRLREISGPNAGEGPTSPTFFRRNLHFSIDANAAFFADSGQWWRIDLATGDRTLLFEGGNPQDFPDTQPSDLYYVASRDALLASTVVGLYEISLDTGVAALRSLTWLDTENQALTP